MKYKIFLDTAAKILHHNGCNVYNDIGYYEAKDILAETIKAAYESATDSTTTNIEDLNFLDKVEKHIIKE